MLAGVDVKVTLLLAQLCKQARSCVLQWRGYITKTVYVGNMEFEAHDLVDKQASDTPLPGDVFEELERQLVV